MQAFSFDEWKQIERYINSFKEAAMQDPYPRKQTMLEALPRINHHKFSANHSKNDKEGAGKYSEFTHIETLFELLKLIQY